MENIIREDINVELLEILELYCELLLARIGLLEGKDCDPGLEEAVKTIIYSAQRTEIKELHVIREMLMHKFGKDFSQDAKDAVPEKVMKRLSVEPPSQELVVLYLKEIARAYNAPFSELSDEEEGSETDDEPDNGQVKLPIFVDSTDESTDDAKLRRLSGMADLPDPSLKDSKAPPVEITGPSPTTDNVRPSIKIPTTKKNTKSDNELDDLKRRFEALRK